MTTISSYNQVINILTQVFVLSPLTIKQVVILLQKQNKLKKWGRPTLYGNIHDLEYEYFDF